MWNFTGQESFLRKYWVDSILFYILAEEFWKIQASFSRDVLAEMVMAYKGLVKEGDRLINSSPDRHFRELPDFGRLDVKDCIADHLVSARR